MGDFYSIPSLSLSVDWPVLSWPRCASGVMAWRLSLAPRPLLLDERRRGYNHSAGIFPWLLNLVIRGKPWLVKWNRKWNYCRRKEG